MKLKTLTFIISVFLSTSSFAQDYSASQENSLLGLSNSSESTALGLPGYNPPAQPNYNQQNSYTNNTSQNNIYSQTQTTQNTTQLPAGLVNTWNKVMHTDLAQPAKNAGAAIMNTQVTPKGLGVAALALSTGTMASGSLSKAAMVEGAAYVGSAGAFGYLLAHPDKIDTYLGQHPEQVPSFTDYLENKKAHAADQANYDYYDRIERALGLDGSDLEHQQQIEASALWQQLLAQVEGQIQAINIDLTNQGKQPSCTIQDLQKLTWDKKSFDSLNLPTSPSLFPLDGTAPLYSVNSYAELSNNYTKYKDKTVNPIIQQQDHIPSYKSIELFLQHKGITINKTYISSNGKTKEYQRLSSLENNTSAVATPEEIHKMGRTNGPKNKDLYPLDAQNLEFATAKDIASTAYAIATHTGRNYNITADQYIDSAMTLYVRNKMLCLYDIPY